MLTAIAQTKPQLHRSALPKEMEVSFGVGSSSAFNPTHLLAVYAKPSPAQPQRNVTLFPAHDVVLATHCAHMPTLPPSTTASHSQPTLPVVPLCLPAPETFATLQHYLYTKRTDTLLAALVPSLSSLPAQPVSTLLQRATVIHGLWRNVCALGVSDEQLWRTMDVAWEAVLRALAVATSQPSMESDVVAA